jgi:hypothetical protein
MRCSSRVNEHIMFIIAYLAEHYSSLDIHTTANADYARVLFTSGFIKRNRSRYCACIHSKAMLHIVLPRSSPKVLNVLNTSQQLRQSNKRAHNQMTDIIVSHNYYSDVPLTTDITPLSVRT